MAYAKCGRVGVRNAQAIMTSRLLSLSASRHDADADDVEPALDHLVDATSRQSSGSAQRLIYRRLANPAPAVHNRS